MPLIAAIDQVYRPWLFGPIFPPRVVVGERVELLADRDVAAIDSHAEGLIA